MDLVVQIHHLINQNHAQNHVHVQSHNQEDGPEEAPLQSHKKIKNV